jgi:acetyl-CoA acetyltransferase
LRGKAAITGVGSTDFSKNSGRTVLALALEACSRAVADAGVNMDDVDGVLTYGLNDSVWAQAVATGLGLPRLRYFANYSAGGDISMASIGEAAKAVIAGEARHILVYRAMNGRSGKRVGGTGTSDDLVGAGEAQFTYPHGWISFPQYNAMPARRHMIKYGTTSEDLGYVAVQMRENAAANPRALYRIPITIEDHQNSRIIADPLRLLDCCLETDGACAVLVSSAEGAKDLRAPVVSIIAWMIGGGPKPGYGYDGFYTWQDGADMYAKHIADELWRRAGLGPADIDVASIYDCFTFSVISQLEGYGFCKPGEGAAFVRVGQIAKTGQVAVNLNGGMLSEAYIHGFNGLVELVHQLRGEAGERQRPGASVGLATGFGTTTGSGLVLAAA